MSSATPHHSGCIELLGARCAPSSHSRPCCCVRN